ncbi:FKBP-type peptidyl-prolyl cis-trans isomerase [Candidatus Saccharibacteria bacterium]|nr:FKBP-type peptidyl-prolyl cis-trans isomerase [Candidatus Saccharibacteria bacterium]
MANKRERFFALFGAILFLVTASAFSILVVWTLVTSKDDQNTDTNTTSNNSQTEDSKLQGTQLNDFTPVADVSSLQKTDIKTGTGEEVQPGDTVTVDYTGAVAATGIIFQSSLDSGQPVSFGLNQVIKGWTDGVPGMKVGGTRRLLIPSDQAYGANPPAGSGIPANAALVFDITLHKIGN